MTTHQVLYTPGSRSMFLVMDCMDTNLYQVMAAQPRGSTLPLAHTKLLTRQLLRGVAHMHARGVMHRDIKPENVLLKDDTVKLADFGLACLACDPLERVRKCGTLQYMPPEMRLRGDYGPAVDVWAVGCILLELVLGNVTEEDVPPSSTFCTFSPEQMARLKKELPAEYSNVLDLLRLMLCVDPVERVSAASALCHPCFAEDPSPPPAAGRLQLPCIVLLKRQFGSTSQHARDVEAHLARTGVIPCASNDV